MDFIDDINYAPQEIEELMSLLEEDPSLVIYENDPVLFFTKNKTKIRNKEKNFEIIEIHPNFRLFITSSSDVHISSAIKSRCVCIKIKPFKKPKEYAELISNSLINTGIADNNIIDISKKIGYAFYKLKEKEEQSKYLLKNYILTSVNFVNLSKIYISNQPINSENLSKIIEFSIFSTFKETEKNESIEYFRDFLKEDTQIEINPIRNVKRSHEYYLSMYEINIISYYYVNHKEDVNIIDTINNKIQKKLNIKSKFKENRIKKDIKVEIITQEIPRKYLLEKIELFALPEINEYKNEIYEVIQILQEFIEEKDSIYEYFYFLIYLKDILDKLTIINEEKLFGIRINKMESDINFFNQYGIKEQASFYANTLFWFRNMINSLKIIFLKKFVL